MGAESTLHTLIRREMVVRDIPLTIDRFVDLERAAARSGVSIERAVSDALRDEVAPGTLASQVTFSLRYEGTGIRMYTLGIAKSYSDSVDIRRARRGDGRSLERVVLDAIDKYTGVNHSSPQVTRHGH